MVFHSKFVYCWLEGERGGRFELGLVGSHSFSSSMGRDLRLMQGQTTFLFRMQAEGLKVYLILQIDVSLS